MRAVLKTTVAMVLMSAVLFGGSYWYYTALAGCNVPISYTIGDVDPRFGLSEEEVRNAVSGAESLWEDGTDRNLFTQSPEGKLVINFIYDERQELTNELDEFEELLDRKETMSETVQSEYQRLVSEYNALRASYEANVRVYEAKLDTYNDEVAEWNNRGGAPRDVFARLQLTKTSLESEENRLNTRSRELNTLVRKINNLGTQGNSLVTNYNSLVNEYNEKFSEGKEFTQGEYEDDVINIYEYGDMGELIIVLAHEMGHALDIGHVDGAESIMYFHMEEQGIDIGLTDFDRTAFTESCGSKGGMTDTLEYLRKTLEALLRQLS